MGLWLPPVDGDLWLLLAALGLLAWCALGAAGVCVIVELFRRAIWGGGRLAALGTAVAVVVYPIVMVGSFVLYWFVISWLGFFMIPN